MVVVVRVGTSSRGVIGEYMDTRSRGKHVPDVIANFGLLSISSKQTHDAKLEVKQSLNCTLVTEVMVLYV